jgi:predicted ester cyclase
MTIEDNFGVDDKVVVRWSAEMTHTGDHLGFPATNRTVRITGITIAQIENGKIVRGWDKLMQPSGLAFSPDGRHFYADDSE